LIGFYQVGEKLQPKAINIAPKLDIDKKKPPVNSEKVKQVATKTIKKSLESKVNTTANTGKCHHD